MIEHFSHVLSDEAGLYKFLNTPRLLNACDQAASILVQIYSQDTDGHATEHLAHRVRECLPQAVIVGSSTVGEIVGGELHTNDAIIGVTSFEYSQVAAVASVCETGQDEQTGARLGERIEAQFDAVAGVLLLATPLSIDATALIRGLSTTTGTYPKFGAGAADYAAMQTSLVYCHPTGYKQGVVAVVFSGETLHIELSSHLGWRPLSKVMQITRADGMTVHEIDHRPAFDIYARYLGIANDANFFLNTLEFPLLLERDDERYARVPVRATAAGALEFVADIHEGETFRIGCGDVNEIVRRSSAIHRRFQRFAPQTVFLFSGGIRRFLMQEMINLETRPFEQLAPTFGFYAYGEFQGTGKIALRNSAMLAVGLREGDAEAHAEPIDFDTPDGEPLLDPYQNKHSRVMSRLVQFISAVTDELESANREALRLAVTDHLTGIANRTRLDRVIDDQISISARYRTPLSIAMIDVDDFKSVNDTHGHQVGDQVLIDIATLVDNDTRRADTVGRWGGEEFMVISPNTSLDQAATLAEKIRSQIENARFTCECGRTVSVGVASYQPGDDLDSMVKRADDALYRAKHTGRNRVARR